MFRDRCMSHDVGVGLAREATAWYLLRWRTRTVSTDIHLLQYLVYTLIPRVNGVAV